MGEGNFLWSKEGSVRRHRRTHGLQMPLHPQQVIGWIVIALVIALMYGALIPALHSDFIAPVAAASATLFLAHIICHATALMLDPAHPQLRERKYKVLIPEFDRNVHSHVIENGRCHVCNITITSSRTKHCSACNKCVDVFDHHCKWLNNCIGQRNYRVFLATVITAILSCMVVMATCVTEIVFYYFNRPYLAPWDGQIPTISSVALEDESGTVLCQKGDRYCHFSVFGVYLYDGPFIGIVSILFFVTLVAAVLLIHLVVFHCYLLFIGLTTFEYIRGTHGSPTRSYNRGKEDGTREGVTCSWSSRKGSNQITPSSTTDTALLPSPDTPNTTTTSIGTVSPRSNPSTPADDTRQLLGGRHQMVHHKQPLSPRYLLSGGSTTQSNFPIASFPSKPSSVPSLPKIPGAKNCSSLHTISKNVMNSKGSSNSSFEDDPDLTYHLVSVPRPNRPSRRRLKSSVVPHLSPIKECDNSSTSPPSVRTYTPSSSRSYDLTSNLSSETKRLPSPRKSSKFSRNRGKNTSYVNGDERNLLVKVAGRDQSPNTKYSSVPSPNKKSPMHSSSKSPRRVRSKSPIRSSSKSPMRSSSKSPMRSQSSPMKKSSSFGGSSSNRIATPTLRIKLPKEGFTNGHIVKSSPATIIDTSNGNVVSNGQLLSIVKSRSDGLLIKMGDMSKGGVYLGPHKKDPFIVTTGSSKINKSNGKTLVEHHM